MLGTLQGKKRQFYAGIVGLEMAEYNGCKKVFVRPEAQNAR